MTAVIITMTGDGGTRRTHSFRVWDTIARAQKWQRDMERIGYRVLTHIIKEEDTDG